MQFFVDDNEKGDNVIKKLLQPFRFYGRHKINFCLIARPWLQFKTISYLQLFGVSQLASCNLRERQHSYTNRHHKTS